MHSPRFIPERPRFAAAIVGLMLASFLPASLSFGAPRAEAWARWERSDETSGETVDHSAFSGFLTRYVRPDATGLNRVDYRAVSAKDRRALKSYLQHLQETEVSRLGRDQQRAFWTNLYNALTVEVVLEHYPVASIRDIKISPGFFSTGPWGKKLARVEGVRVSLDDIEHRILRPIWKDPRTHYAVNCASIGCPNLLTEAFEADALDEQLDAAARGYVNHPRGARVTDGELEVSSIYSWFESDFGGSEKAVIAHLREYAEPALRERLRGIDSIDDHDYDWSLNDIKR